MPLPGLLPALLPPAASTSVRIVLAGGEDVAIIAIIMGTLSGVFYPLVRSWARRLDGGASSAAPVLRNVDDRLERIERAVETMSIEVERISEGQRFVTKLLAEKSPTHLPPGNP